VSIKKKIISLVTGAIVTLAAATTFAAANPFSDVNEDHWAYDAVSQLAADGVIEGYGDGTYRGDRNITRYEMAQMVARAMSKTDVSAVDKALIDKLAAEFSEELNSLGVRVSNLEKYADKVVWKGKMEYTYRSLRTEDKDSKGETTSHRENQNGFVFRLEPKAEINKNWTANARIDGKFDMKKDDAVSIRMTRGWAQGNYKNFTAKVGRFQIKPAHEHGLVWDTEMSGAMLTFGKDVKVDLVAGRVSNNSVENYDTFLSDASRINDNVSSMQGIRVQYDGTVGKEKGLSAGVAYYRVLNDNFSVLKNNNRSLYEQYLNNAISYNQLENNLKREDQANIWVVNAGYKFSKKADLWATYANNPNVDYQKDSWQAQFTYGDYKDAQKAGSWNVYLAYRKLGYGASVAATVNDDAIIGTKGVAIGAAYAPMKNVGLLVKYYRGKDIDNDNNASRLFGRIEMFF